MTIIRCWDLIRCCFPAAADPVVKGAYCNVVFTTPVSICHAALAAFIDKPELLRHRNTGFASTCHNLLPNLKKVIITSSKFVTRNGYQIKNQHDYCPHTKYGESKVETEIRVWGDEPQCDWCIIRPTSIWGPWFGVPYRNFFDMVMKRMYFHIGKIKCHKTYGYIGNSIYQIEQLLFNETTDKNNNHYV